MLNTIEINSMNEYVFKTCSQINNLLNESREKEAREELIKLLDFHERKGMKYNEIVNHLIREVGLYPYIKTDTANWEDRFVCEAKLIQEERAEYYIGNNHSFLKNY